MNTCTICSSFAEHGAMRVVRLDADDDAAEARMMFHEPQRFLDRRR